MRKITLLIAILCMTVMANAVLITKQYAATDVAALQADIASGAADIYELTTPGGNYQFLFASAASTSNVISKSMTIRAAANLYAKPILSISNPTTGSSWGLFSTATAGITITFQSLEFNGINPNTSTGGTQPTLIWSTAANDNLYISNCYIHDFKNTSGNGLLKFDVASTSQTIDIQNTTFNTFGGRMIYMGASTATTFNIINNTFVNSTLISSRGNIIYVNGNNSANTTVDHCTFYNLIFDTGRIIRMSSGTNGTVTAKNSIFDTTIAAIGIATTATAINCYLGNVTATTNTSPQSTPVPNYVNKLILDFTLTTPLSYTSSDASYTIGNLSYYPSATALAAPSQPNDASSIGYVNFTAGWTPVTGASGYIVYVYNSALTALITSITIGGQSTNSVLINGLIGGTTYKYTVKSLSDGSLNSNSVESPISNLFTTLTPIVLTVPTVGTASVIGGTGFVANWTPIANATNYTINIYNSVPTLVKSVTTTTGQATTNSLVTGLTASTAYTYKVIALGDGGHYTSSVESSASASFNTINLVATVPTVGSATAIAGESFVANWTPVANVTSYTIKVYDSTPTLIKTVTTPTLFGANLNSICITGLSLNTSYTYSVISVGDGVYTTTSTESTKSNSFTTLATYPTSINTNLNDGTWGVVYPAVPNTGVFPTYSINGFDLVASALTSFTTIGAAGEVHINRISLDKSSATASVTLPTISSVAEIEIHFAMGTATNTINLRKYNTGTSTWDLVGAYSYDLAYKTAGTDQIILVSNTTPLTNVKYRIENNTSGSCYIAQIITRPTASLTALAAPTGALSATNTSSTGFTANWPSIVPNAIGYKVNVYSNKLKTLIKTVTVSNPSALSLAITGLQADSTYTYGVVGLGDNTTYSDGLILMATTPVVTNMAAPVLGSVTTIVNNGFTAVWTPVNNAVSYNVLVYDGATLLQTNNVSGQATSSLNITGLSGSGTYTYTVIAKGDGVAHFDSAPSVASGSISTLTTNLNNLNEKSFITASGKTIISSKTGCIQVYNLQGAKMIEAQMVNKLNTNLASGIYLVKFTEANGLITNAKVQIK